MIDKLVTISGFVEGRLVRFDDSQEALFSARQLAESPVDLKWDVFDDGRRMVGEAADVQRGGVGLHVGLVSASGEVQSDVEEVDDLLKNLKNTNKVNNVQAPWLSKYYNFFAFNL